VSPTSWSRGWATTHRHYWDDAPDGLRYNDIVSSPTSSLPLRPVTENELRPFFDMLVRAFGEHMSDEDFDAELLTAERERTLAGFDGETMVSTAGAFSFDLAVPGGRLPAGGVTYVGVAPTHRRQGLMSAMMRHQLADIHDRGEPLAVLWASEAVIYGRFGYGLATRRLNIEVDRVDARLRADAPADDTVSLHRTTSKELHAAIRVVDDSVAPRPGSFRRNDGWIESLTVDTEERRSGYSPLECVVARRGGEPVGYLAYRTKPGSVRPYNLWDGDASVLEQQGLDPAVNTVLTRYLLSLDLVRRVRWWNQPADSALPHLLSDPRQARTTVTDALHLRVVDVAAALAGRRYLTPLDLVFELADRVLSDNAGRWRLHAGPDGASCERTDATPDLSMDVEALGSAYLGGTSLMSLAAAGRLMGAPEAIRSASVAFGWDVQPWCHNVF
jgi:predicted acetyltransferase